MKYFDKCSIIVIKAEISSGISHLKPRRFRFIDENKNESKNIRMMISPDLHPIHETASFEKRIPETPEEIYRLFDTPIMHEAIQLLNVADLQQNSVILAKGFVKMAESYHALIDSLPSIDDPKSKENISATMLSYYTLFMKNLKPLLDALSEDYSNDSEIK